MDSTDRDKNIEMLCVTSCNTVIEAGDREEEKESKKLSVPGSFMPSKTKYYWNLKLVRISTGLFVMLHTGKLCLNNDVLLQE